MPSSIASSAIVTGKIRRFFGKDDMKKSMVGKYTATTVVGLVPPENGSRT